MSKPDYDTTLARIAGNLAGHYVTENNLQCDAAIAEWSVALARAIVAEVKRTAPSDTARQE